MEIFKFPWTINSPDSLLSLCSYELVKNPHRFCDGKSYNGMWGWTLKEGIALPAEICERLLLAWQDSDIGAIDNRFIFIFNDTNRTRLRRASLKKFGVSDTAVEIVLNHNLVELEIDNCENLTINLLECINKKGHHLLSLSLKGIDLDGYLEPYSNECVPPDITLDTPNLRKLVAKDLESDVTDSQFLILLKSLKKLNYLDLSNNNVPNKTLNFEDFSYLLYLENLTYLNLYNIQSVHKAIPTINKLKFLRFLDISVYNQKYGRYTNPKSVLTSIIVSHPNLTGLDISGTNLPYADTFDKEDLLDLDLKEDPEDMLCDIPGLQSRIKNPLEFLGLYNTGACFRDNIPAKVITGDANREQILAATAAYMDRPGTLVKVLNDLFHIFRYETCSDQTRALNLVLMAMSRYGDMKNIQISGSAALFYIVKHKSKSELPIKVGQKIIKLLLDGMENFFDDPTMVRNACLTICQFNIPKDVVCDYRRLVKLLLRLIVESDSDQFIRRLAIHLINSLSCQVDGKHKELVGSLGAIEILLGLINEKLVNECHDDVLDIAWSAMWNVTDETPLNCQRFLDKEGMNYFQLCLQKFFDKAELLRNMMGLLGNVAEVDSLRPRLLEPKLIATFADLLDFASDGIEVSYNAAGVLSHIASDGEEAWSISSPSREEVLNKMVNAIQRWDLSTNRHINYRSFEPILRLLKVNHTPQCQHWAVWALANLTQVYPEKYCALVKKEGGLDLLLQLIESDSIYPCIRELATTVIKRCQDYKGEVVDE